MSPAFNLLMSDCCVKTSIAITTSPGVLPIVVPVPAYVLLTASVMLTFILTVSNGESIPMIASSFARAFPTESFVWKETLL